VHTVYVFAHQMLKQVQYLI